jgi:hypothetical protein
MLSTFCTVSAGTLRAATAAGGASLPGLLSRDADGAAGWSAGVRVCWGGGGGMPGRGGGCEGGALSPWLPPVRICTLLFLPGCQFEEHVGCDPFVPLEEKKMCPG